jgi:hypothetical protein
MAAGSVGAVTVPGRGSSQAAPFGVSGEKGNGKGTVGEKTRVYCGRTAAADWTFVLPGPAPVPPSPSSPLSVRTTRIRSPVA